MAKTKAKKKAAPSPKRPAVKPAAKKSAGAKPAAKKKPAPAVRAKVASKAKPAPAKPKAKPAVKTAAKAAAKAKPAAKPAKSKAPAKAVSAAKSASAAKGSGKRAVAVSHRPQAAAVAVQARPAKAAPVAPTAAAPVPARARQTGADSSGPYTSEEQIRRAPDSAYMNDAQLAFFQERLLQMRGEVLTRELDVKERLHQREVFADPADRASAEEEHWLDLRLRERESLLLKKIDDALRRIRDKEYGYCEKTGEPIGIARLLARPTATVCVDIKGQDERAESQYRDR